MVPERVGLSAPRVTILIPNYNGKKWLVQCLPTIEKNTYPNKEILVVNNGSTDDSAEFLKKIPQCWCYRD